MSERGGLYAVWQDAWLMSGARTPFVDYRGALSAASPTDLGIKAARGLFGRGRLAPEEVDAVIVGNMAQASYDAYMMPRHVGLYAGVPVSAPALMVQRVCATGLELLTQAADTIALGRARAVLCVAAESMSRNPLTNYTHRQMAGEPPVYRDFLWEALHDSACKLDMGGTAERLAMRYGIDRVMADAYASRSFARALAAREGGWFDEELVTLSDEDFECPGLEPRQLRLHESTIVDRDTHLRASSPATLAGLKPVFGGIQTAGNSAGICDGAAATLVVSGAMAKKRGRPLARLLASTTVGVDPAEMGIGPVPAIRRLLESHDLDLADIDCIEINEAFAAQVLACAQALDIDAARLNVHGGAIALGHPLAATGLRLAITCARELSCSGGRYGIVAACVGGGQGMALLLENTGAWPVEL